MLNRLSLLLITSILFFGCDHKKHDKVWVYTDVEFADMLNNTESEILNGNVKELYTGDSLSKNDNYYKVTFDYNGNMINSVAGVILYVDSKGQRFYTRTSYTYTFKNGKVTSIIKDSGRGYNPRILNFDTSGHISDHYIKYDKSGDLVESKQTYAPNIYSPNIYRYRYDNEHRLVEANSLNEKVLLIRKTFKYISFDSHKNWVKKIVYQKLYPPMKPRSSVDTIIRKIFYY